MNVRLPALAALLLGLLGAGLALFAWPVAAVLGLGAAALGAIVLRQRPASPERGLGLGGLALGVLAVALAVVVAVFGSEPADEQRGLTYLDGIATATPDDEHPPQSDIQRPLPCRVEIGVLRAGGTIVNRDAVPADYLLIVVWEENGVELGRNTVIVNNVTPGLSRTFEASVPGDGTSLTICRVERIDRSPTNAGGSTSSRRK